MELKNINPFKLEHNPWNSNHVKRPEFEKLKESLTRYGSFKPVIVRTLKDGTYQILGGAHRVEAARELGWPEIPVLILGEVPDDKAKEIGLIDNTRYGEDDKELLDKLLDELTDLEAFSAVLPETEDVDLELEDELLKELEDGSSLLEEKEDTHRTIKIRLENDKADEVEAILKDVAEREDYKFRDGYSDLGKSLYHILVLDK